MFLDLKIVQEQENRFSWFRENRKNRRTGEQIFHPSHPGKLEIKDEPMSEKNTSDLVTDKLQLVCKTKLAVRCPLYNRIHQFYRKGGKSVLLFFCSPCSLKIKKICSPVLNLFLISRKSVLLIKKICSPPYNSVLRPVILFSTL